MLIYNIKNKGTGAGGNQTNIKRSLQQL